MQLDRREFFKTVPQLFALVSFCHSALATQALPKKIAASLETWMREVEELCDRVHRGALSPQDWQRGIEKAHRSIDLKEILKFTDAEHIIRMVKHPVPKIGAIHNVPWELQGGSSRVNFGHKLFIYRKGACSPPHAHNHLVSAHLVLSGKIRVQTFERVKDIPGHILLRPTEDFIAKPGDVISMSDYENNVHWFTGMTEGATSFDVPVPEIEPKKIYVHQAQSYNQIFLDPTVSSRENGFIKAPIVSFEDSLRIFAS